MKLKPSRSAILFASLYSSSGSLSVICFTVSPPWFDILGSAPNGRR
nr:MAG TPA: hypothetical protein [Caudoviricetes sp.]